jgi:cyclic-di-GMP phosphodiesterase TipF (flagellum assembly factor)
MAAQWALFQGQPSGDMRTLFNFIILACYGGLAGVTVAFGPDWVPWLSQSLAFGLGAALLLGCGLLHEVYTRMLWTIDLRRELAFLNEYCDAQQAELTALRGEVQDQQDAIERVQQSALAGPAGQAGQGGQMGRTVEEVMAEVKVLKSLIPQINAGAVADGGVSGLPAIVKPGTGGAAGGDLPPGFMPPAAENLERETVLDIVRAALRDDRVDVVLQPIVSLPQRKRRFYECFSRLRTEGGAMILPEQYIALAESAGLITAIDNMLLFRCVQLVRKIHSRSENIDFFCNISPHTVADADFFTDFIEFLEGNGALAKHLVFEFGQADFARWSEAGAGLLDRLAFLGCRFSLDRVENLDFDAAELVARHVAFIKIEGDLLLEEVEESVGILRALRRHNIDLIVTKVEDETRLLEILDYDIDFGQGFLFGEPRLARPAA